MSLCSWETPERRKRKYVLKVDDYNHLHPAFPSLDFCSPLCCILLSTVVVLKTGQFCPPGDILQCLETFWLSHWGQVDAVGIWKKPAMLPNILQCMGTASQNKNYLDQNVNSAEVEKPWSGESGSKMVRKNRDRKIKKL